LKLTSDVKKTGIDYTLLNCFFVSIYNTKHITCGIAKTCICFT